MSSRSVYVACVVSLGTSCSFAPTFQSLLTPELLFHPSASFKVRLFDIQRSYFKLADLDEEWGSSLSVSPSEHRKKKETVSNIQMQSLQGDIMRHDERRSSFCLVIH